MFRFGFFAALFSLIGFADTDKKESCPEGKQHYRAAVRHIEKGGIGYEDGYTTLEAFFASDPSQWNTTPFLDMRAHIFDNAKWAANAGIGMRTIWKNRVYGINAYYDYRNPGRFNSNQIGLGLETLGCLFDFRINGYLPVGAKNSPPYDSVFGTFSGNYLLLSQKIQSAMKGADAEFGFHFGESESFDFYAAAGPYYYIGEFTPATWGGKARISGTFKDFFTLEISDSYDTTFHNHFQGQIGFSFSLGPKSKIKEQGRTCREAKMLNARILQPVSRQEIIVVDHPRKNAVAINPATGLPYFFVFVDNTSSSNGTYESPYHSLAQAQENSSANQILYVFPGDGTTNGMNAGIALKASQKFWGSGTNHSLQTSEGTIFIPAQSRSSPTITNTDIDTDGNAITLATNNSISGITIASALNNAIYGVNPQDLEVSSCTIQNTNTYLIEAIFSGNASVSITNNQFLNNVNGIALTFNGTSTLVCSDNTFKNQTSVSSVPLEIAATSNRVTAQVEHNVFSDNTTGSVRLNFNNVLAADISLVNNTITNNGTGSQSSLGSSLTVISSGTIADCTLLVKENTFSNNTSNAVYLHTSGTFTTLGLTASGNTMSQNGGSGLVLATPTNNLTLLATENTITNCNDNGISVIASGTSSIGNIIINNNTITDIENTANGISINQNFSILDMAILNNEINRCEGTGIVKYPPIGIGLLTMDISGNTISNCENASSNAASGISIEQYINFEGTITNNTLLDNTGTALAIGSALSSPTVQLTLSGNSSTNYSLVNPVDGVFRLSPCNVDSVNSGTINASGAITNVQSFPDAAPCAP